MSYRDTIPDLDAMIEQRYISVREHPAAPLFIYNYTAKAQFDRMWNEATRQCRGLILDADGELVARPFRKFFNLGEEESLPDGACRVWEKYDGSLGVLYFVDGRPAIASRGSFMSDQALKASAMLEEKYRRALGRLDPAFTYLFEIIFPENRIVVDYGAREELILLAKVETHTGREFLPEDIGFPVAEQWADAAADPWEWMLKQRKNAEGFVLHWPETNYRVKVKHDDYVKLHRIVTGVSAKAVWEMLRDGGMAAVEAMAARGTPGFAEWLMGTAAELETRHRSVCDQTNAAFSGVPEGMDRRQQAEFIKRQENPHLLFAMLDGKPWERMAWELVKPGRAFETYRKEGE